MTEQQTRQAFKKRVIEALHGLPWEEAVKKEKIKVIIFFTNFPITLSRVLEALGNTNDEIYACDSIGVIHELGIEDTTYYYVGDTGHSQLYWQLTKENGETATDDDQSIETIEALLDIFKTT